MENMCASSASSRTSTMTALTEAPIISEAARERETFKSVPESPACL